MFCMLLRKHIEGFTIEDIRQHELDRMIIFDVKGRNELGDVSQKQLIIEIMGRHSNIILVDHERNMILDSIKHVSYAVNSHRAILPGQEYKLPPAQHKLNPFTSSNEEILRTIRFQCWKIRSATRSAFCRCITATCERSSFPSWTCKFRYTTQCILIPN